MRVIKLISTKPLGKAAVLRLWKLDLAAHNTPLEFILVKGNYFFPIRDQLDTTLEVLGNYLISNLHRAQYGTTWKVVELRADLQPYPSTMPPESPWIRQWYVDQLPKPGMDK